MIDTIELAEQNELKLFIASCKDHIGYTDKHIETLFYDYTIKSEDEIGKLVEAIEQYRPKLYAELTEDTFIKL